MTIPTFVGRYEVRGEIGRGGFAVVVEAWDEELASRVAIKILHADLASSEDFVTRFLREARLLRQIHSPHVIGVHDVGRLDDGRPYFVLDHADRGTLAQRLQRLGQGIDARQLPPLVDALADGIRALHQAGLVHRDLKPDNILFRKARQFQPPSETREGGEAPLVDPDEQILIGDLGIARDVLRDGDAPTVVGGTPLYLAPEQLEASAAVAPSADIYSATAVIWHALTGRPPPPPGRLEDSLGALPLAWQAVMSQGMALDPAGRHADIDEWQAAVFQALEQEHADIALPSAEASQVCPYKGLAAYQMEDAEFFRGREALIDELIKRLHLHPVLVVGGPSGSGKSSLVRGGLLPALKKDALPGSADWRAVVMTPGADPLQEFCTQLGISFAQQALLADAATGAVDRSDLDRLLGETGISGTPELLLVIDQFEELFTLADERQRRGFLTLLDALSRPATSLARIVIAVRADFYDACAHTPWLAETITANQVLVGPMSRSELRRAIVEPARRAGLYLEEALVETIIEDTGTEAGSLPLMAHALVETWVHRDGNTLTLRDYQACGGVAGAISQTAESLYRHRFDASQREIARQLLLRLIASNGDAPETRRILRKSSLMLEENAEALADVIEHLTQARLLTVDEDRIQIAHEALLHTWPRLRDWIEASRDDLRMRQKIADAAAQWQAEGRLQDLLYRGTLLLSAVEWRDAHREQLGPVEHEFLDAAKASRDQYLAREKERQRRARRRRRLAIVALVLLSVGASFSALMAFRAAQEANANATRAAQASARAQARFAAALGSAAFGLASDDPRLALALATESIARAGSAQAVSYDARAAIALARRELAGRTLSVLGSPIPAGEALAITLDPEGNRLAIGHANGIIELYDVPERRLLHRLEGHQGGVRDLEFNPTGRVLASGGVDGTLRLWHLTADGRVEPQVLGQIGDIIPALCFDAEGARIATAGMDGGIRIWDVDRPGQAGRLLARRPVEFNTLEFAPDGKAVVAASNDKRIQAWSTDTGKPLFPAIHLPDAGHFLKLTFNHAGNRLAAVNTDQVIYLVSYPQGKLLPRPFAPEVRMAAAGFGLDSDRLLAGDVEGRLRLWDLAEKHELEVSPPGHSQSITDLVLSQDGRLAATLGADQQVRIWAVSDSTPLSHDLETPGVRLRGVAFAPDGQHLALGGDDGTVRIWNTSGGIALPAAASHKSGVWALAYSPDGQHLASADRSGRISIEDRRTPETAITLDAKEPVWSLAFLDDGQRLVAAADSGLHIWQLSDKSSHRRIGQDGGRITRMKLSPDGNLLATVTTDGRAQLRETHRMSLVREFTAADDTLWSLDFCPDGRCLATASAGGVVTTWDLASGEQLGSFHGHTNGATDLAFLGDGASLIALDRSGRLHWWDTRTRRKIMPPLQAHQGTSWRLAMAADGLTLATAGDDGRARRWDLFDPKRACALGLPAFDPVRREQYLGSEPPRSRCIRPAHRQ